nr:DUF3000 domain-containing protein [Actinomyces bovis]
MTTIPQETNATDAAAPERFREVLLSLRHAPLPRQMVVEEVPAPSRIAPFTAAISAATELESDGQAVASGRFVVLHDPAGQSAWDGDLRLVIQVRTRIEDAMVSDEALGRAAWSWLVESLEQAGVGYRALVGTVTRVVSETFGGLELSDTSAQAEIRASWSPTTTDLGPHLTAWYTTIHLSAGNSPELALPLTAARAES